MVDSSPDGILVMDLEGRTLLRNARMGALWQIPPEVAANPDGTVLLAVIAAWMKDPAEFLAQAAHLQAHPLERSGGDVELLDGTVMDRGSAPVVDRSGHIYGRIWAFRDVTEQRRNEARIRHLASHDDLTDLPNRHLIQERLAQAIASARQDDSRSFALLYLDLDRFKIVNDGYGHRFGDLVLRAVGERLLALARPANTVARYGGDEFLVLLAEPIQGANVSGTNVSGTNVSGANISDFAGEIIRHFQRPLLVQGREVHLSLSIGVSSFPDDGDTPDVLIEHADVAMYYAKAIGRNTYRCFTREMSREAQRRVTLETKLREALSARRFRLAYQPKVSLATGRSPAARYCCGWRTPIWAR